jgi:hypothetical protein
MVADHKIIIPHSQVKCVSFVNKEQIILPLSIEVLTWLKQICVFISELSNLRGGLATKKH